MQFVAFIPCILDTLFLNPLLEFLFNFVSCLVIFFDYWLFLLCHILIYKGVPLVSVLLAYYTRQPVVHVLWLLALFLYI